MKVSKFTVGLVCGAVLGVLFAPAPGSTSRRTVADVAYKVKRSFKRWFGDDLEDLEELKTLLADAAAPLTPADRQRLLQLIENNQKALRDLDL